MTYDPTDSSSSDHSRPASTSGDGRQHGGRSGGARRLVAAVVLVGAGVVAGATGTIAAGAYAFGKGHGHHRFGSPEQVTERIDRKAQWFLDALDADDAQRAEFKSALSDAVNTMVPVVRDHRGRHREWLTALTAPEVDVQALLEMRADDLAALDEATHAMVPKLVALAEVLTPEQRAKVRARVSEHFERHRH